MLYHSILFPTGVAGILAIYTEVKRRPRCFVRDELK